MIQTEAHDLQTLLTMRIQADGHKQEIWSVRNRTSAEKKFKKYYMLKTAHGIREQPEKKKKKIRRMEVH